VALERAELRKQAEQGVILEERQRVARELHDSVTQSLYSLTLLAAAGQRSAQDGSMERTVRNLEKVSMVAFQTLKEMRLLVYELQPSILTKGGFTEAIQRRLDAVEEHAGMQTKFVVDVQNTLPKMIEIELYGLAQEALNNSIKHSGANAVFVHLYETEDTVILEINDNGNGFNLDNAKQKHGAGINSMMQRVKNLGGNLEINSEPEKGTTIKAKIPKVFE
jgi:signal transduction histidine kinase